MRILFRKKLTPLVTYVQSNTDNISGAYNTTKNNFENPNHYTLQPTTSDEVNCISDIQSFNVNHSQVIQKLADNIHHNDSLDDKIDDKVEAEGHKLKSFKEDVPSYQDIEPLTITTEHANKQEFKISENITHNYEDDENKTTLRKYPLTDEIQSDNNSKKSFSITSMSQSKTLRRSKSGCYRNSTESFCGTSSLMKNSIIDKNVQFSVERLKAARDEADEAIKSRKVFSVLGPYNPIRQALRARGWIEKFDVYIGSSGNTSQDTSKSIRSINDNKTARNYNSLSNDTVLGDSEDGDSDDDVTAATEEKQRIHPWEEDNGYYGVLSRMVRSEVPRFIWSLRKSQVDFRDLQKDQMINHHTGAPFTTKVGLCRQLRNIRWFADCDADRFFPRCFIISEEDDRQAFINDFKLTACISLVKMIASLIPDIHQSEANVSESSVKLVCDIDFRSNLPVIDSNQDNCLPFQDNRVSFNTSWNINILPSDLSKITQIPDEIVDFAIFQCQEFLRTKHHEDLDKSKKQFLATEHPWDGFLSWYYYLVKTPHLLTHAQHLSSHCQLLCKLLKKCCPQFDMDGSRGRGIVCLDRLDDILKIVQGTVYLTEARYVVQKFSSQEFTLDNFSEAIHLCNNCIQHKYKNGARSGKLPDENMWTWEQFQTWLSEQGHPNLWKENIQPSMKNAVLNALLSAQELIEPRKNCFGLYGADFLLTADDFKIWLIEINSSPCMSPSTSVTAVYTSNVLEDTLKDRKSNRNSDVGRFELLYKQNFHYSSSMYTGMELYVTGLKIVKPQSENTNISRCLHKTTLNGFNYHQSTMVSDVNIVSSSVKDKSGQIKSYALKQIVKLSNTSETGKSSTVYIKGISFCKLKYKEFIETITPSIIQTNQASQLKLFQSKNNFKSDSDINMIKSDIDIEYLTDMASNVCLLKSNNQTTNHNDISRNKYTLKSKQLEGIDEYKSSMKSNESYITNDSRNLSELNLKHKGNHNHSVLYSSHTDKDSKRKNSLTSSLLLPTKMHKIQNSITCIKLVNLNMSKLKTLSEIKRISLKHDNKTNTSNIETLNGEVSNLTSSQRKQITNQTDKLNILPPIIKMRYNSMHRHRYEYKAINDLRIISQTLKSPTFRNCVHKVKLNTIHFNERNTNLRHFHVNNSNCNDLHRHIGKKSIVFCKIRKKMKKSSDLHRKLSISQLQSKYYKILSKIMNLNI
ncbi:unnamed protein product [Heterobilharzia americana]|nr:unnamed protein product [Heterobilharzia americana]